MSTTPETAPDLRGGAVRIPRTRGALSGVLLIILGAWAAIIPFIGPLFSYGYTPNKSWDWTAPRGWLEVLPGVVALVAGVVLLVSANRVTTSAAGWLGIAAGGWLVIGRDVAGWLHVGSPGVPISSSHFLAALESLGLFSGVGGLIVLIAALAVGRLSIRSVRDVRVAQRQQLKAERRRRSISESAYAAGRRDEAAERERAVDDDQTGAHAAEPAPAEGGTAPADPGYRGQPAGGPTYQSYPSGPTTTEEPPR